MNFALGAAEKLPSKQAPVAIARFLLPNPLVNRGDELENLATRLCRVTACTRNSAALVLLAGKKLFSMCEFESNFKKNYDCLPLTRTL